MLEDRRILTRYGLVPEDAGYSAVQEFLHKHLAPDEAMFNEYHALLVEAGKRFCRRREARCEDCPLWQFLPERRAGRDGKLEM